MRGNSERYKETTEMSGDLGESSSGRVEIRAS